MNFKAINREDIPAFVNSESPYAVLLKDFLDSNIEYAEINEFQYGASATASSLRNLIARGKLPVRVMQRGNRLFLINTKKGAANETVT